MPVEAAQPPMNLLYLNHYAGTPLLGMEYRPYYLAREWVRLGHQVIIAAASYAHTRRLQPSAIGCPTEVDGIGYRWCATPGYQKNGVGRFFNILAFLAQLYRLGTTVTQWRPDVVIASSTYPMDIYPARLLARQAKAKLVWELHDLWPLSLIELSGMRASHPFARWAQRAENVACQSADHIVSLLPSALPHLVQHGMPPERFSYVPNGVCPQEWDAQATAPPPAGLLALVQQARSSQHVLLGYTGAFGKANALEFLLKAAFALREERITFVLIGQGPEKSSLMAQAAGNSLKNVHFLEPISKLEIPAALRLFDALYLGWQKKPLYRFGISPNKLIDYWMAAKPVIHAADLPDDVIRKIGCGLSVDPDEPAALVDAIRQVVSLSAEARLQMGERGRQYAQAHHDYAQLARRFLAHIQSRSFY